MTFGNFNWLDYLFSSIFVLFILLSLWRGLVKEIISIGAWAAGLFIGFMFAPKLAALFTDSSAVQATLTHAGSKVSEHATTESSFAVGVCFVILLVGTLVIGAIISYIMAKVVQVSGISFFNRLLGGVFGFIKGFIVNLVILFCTQMTSYAEEPAWKQSQIVQAYQPVIALLENKMGPEFEDLKAKIKQALDSGQDAKSSSHSLSSSMNSFTGIFSSRS